jgi:hypothetical protein
MDVRMLYLQARLATELVLAEDRGNRLKTGV